MGAVRTLTGDIQLATFKHLLNYWKLSGKKMMLALYGKDPMVILIRILDGSNKWKKNL